MIIIAHEGSIAVKVVDARRIPITDKMLPFLATDSGSVVKWSSADMMEMIHAASWIEVAPRGIRLVFSNVYHHSPSLLFLGPSMFPLAQETSCLASPDALCWCVFCLLPPSPLFFSHI